MWGGGGAAPAPPHPVPREEAAAGLHGDGAGESGAARPGPGGSPFSPPRSLTVGPGLGWGLPGGARQREASGGRGGRLVPGGGRGLRGGRGAPGPRGGLSPRASSSPPGTQKVHTGGAAVGFRGAQGGAWEVRGEDLGSDPPNSPDLYPDLRTPCGEAS